MNFQKLNEFYPWQDCPTSLRGQSTLLLDSSNTSKSTLHSGFFIFVTVLLQSLQTNNKDNDKILLILTDNTKSHYDTIFKKNYIDLKLLEKQNRLQIVSLYSTEEDREDYFSSLSSPLTDNEKDLHWTWNDLQNWKENYQLSWKNIKKIRRNEENSFNNDENNEKFLIFIENLTSFEVISPSITSARKFLYDIINSIEALLTLPSFLSVEEGNTKKYPSILGLVSFSPVPNDIDEGQSLPTLADPVYDDSPSILSFGPLHSGSVEPKLVEYLRYRSATIVLAAPLKTGYSTTIHGTLTISRRLTHEKIVLQYRALDSGIQCIPFNGKI